LAIFQNYRISINLNYINDLTKEDIKELLDKKIIHLDMFSEKLAEVTDNNIHYILFVNPELLLTDLTAFQKNILDPLKIKETATNPNGEISISELKDYVFYKVSELTDGMQNPTSRKENLEFDFSVW